MRNAESIHPEWQLQLGDGIRLHPKMPPLPITVLVPGSHLVAFAGGEQASQAHTWTAASWLFLLEPLDEGRCRLISRYRAACSDDLATRLAFGPALLEPIGFVMDRRMLDGIKQRAEAVRARSADRALATPT